MWEEIEVEILNRGDSLALTFAGDPTKRFHAIWLRDNAWDEATRASGNGQKLISLAAIPAPTRVRAARTKAGSLHATSPPGARSTPSDPKWLVDHASDKAEARSAGWT